MMRRVVNSSLRFRVLAMAAAAAVVVYGVTQFSQSAVDVYPEFEPTFVEVQTEALGLSANEVEQLITVPLEADLLNGVAWVTDIRSQSVPGLSSVTLTFEPGTDLFEARQAVQERLAQAHALPQVSKPPQMLPPVSSTSRTMMIGLSSDSMSLIEISQLARWTIKPRLMGVEGVANVSSFGQRERQLQVQVDPERLDQNGVSLQQVIETTGNALTVSPLTFLEASTPGTGGFIETANQRLGVRHVSPIESAEDLAKVAVVDTASLRLGDVAEIVEDHQPLIGDAIVDGKPGVMLVVEKLRGANTVEVTEDVEIALAALRPGLSGLNMDTTVFRPADYVTSAAGNVGLGLMAGVALAIALLALAFYQWRTALVSVVGILTSLAAAALVLDVFDATFNLMILAGLAVGVAIVIDDAVVGSEAIARRVRERGERSVAVAIVDASAEVRSAAAYASLFVFLPVVPLLFMGDLLGAFGRPLAVAYALALLASMVTALVVTPALSVLVFSGRDVKLAESPAMAAAGRRYEGALGRALAAPRPVLLGVGALVVVSVLLLPTLRQAQLPGLQERDVVVQLKADPGTSLQKMNELISEAAAGIGAVPGVDRVAGHVGRAVTGDQVVGVNSAALWVALEDKVDRGRTLEAVDGALDGLSGVDHQVLSYQQARLEDSRGSAEKARSPIEVGVYGHERDLLASKADEVGKALASIDGITDLEVAMPVEEPTLQVEVDLDRAKEFGVKPGDVRRAAAILLSGLDVGQLFYDQKIFDVVVWGAPDTRRDEADVRNLLIETPGGDQIRLEDVADVSRVSSPDVIEREGVFRRIDITADVSGRSRDAVAADVVDKIRSLSFPLEYRAELLDGFAEERAADRRLLGLGAFAGVAMLLLLQACFGSWRLSVAFFLTLPLSVAGSVLAAMAGRGPVTVGGALGALAVLALAARNGILLVKRYQHLERREEQQLDQSLVTRGARERLAPTLVSAATAAVAFAPFVVLGTRPGFEILGPMGVAVLGGLVTTTAVSLFVLPAMYLHFSSVKSETELDLHLFEEELRVIDLTDRARPGAAPATPSTDILV